MQEPSFSSRPLRISPFRSAGRSGTVRVYYGLTRHGKDSGFTALKGFGADRAGRGFPTIKCEVRCDEPGYWSVLGWIQWVTQDFGKNRTRVELVDRLPSMLDRDLPFVSVGYSPTFFDAPAFNSLPKVDWHASLFLCTLPMLSRSEAIEPLAGFLWGYRIERARGDVVPYRLQSATAGDWIVVRRRLAERHPQWKFARTFKGTARPSYRGGRRKGA
ncbi:MAG: hypothetical protein WAN87_00690 [Thermoplasmata archaeon]